MTCHHLTPPRGPVSPRHRGFAMLLVLISLMMATILTVAYLSSRDNSMVIGKNVSEAAAARWAASSGIELAVSIMQTESPWRTGHVGGRIISDFNIASASIDIDLIDLETDAPPTSASNQIKVRATATVGDIEQVATAYAFVSTTADGTVDIDLSEFAAFASNGLATSGTSAIERWSSAPMTKYGTPIYIGTHATSASGIRFDSTTRALDTTVYHVDGASNFLVTDPSVGKTSLIDPIPMPLAPPIDPGTPATPPPALDMNAAVLVSGNTRYDSVRMNTGLGVMTVQGNSSIIVDGDFELGDNAGLVIDGNVRMLVLGRFQLDPDSYVELRPNAKLHLYLADEVDLEDAYMGDERADKLARDTAGTAEYMEVERLAVFGTEPADLMPKPWRFDGTSVVKASVYAPFADISMEKDSAVYGRLASSSLAMKDNSSLYYDPALDERRGYTNPRSKLFDEDGRIRTSLLSCPSLDEVVLETIATVEDIAISLLGALIGTTNDLVDADDVDADDPTPRPIPVQFNLVSSGTDVLDWEQMVSGP